MSYKEDLERIAAQQRNKVSPEDLERDRQWHERQRAKGRADEILARIARDKTSMNAFIKESRILELLRQAGQILHKGQKTDVSFYVKCKQKSRYFPEVVSEGSLFRDWIIEGMTITAEMHHADVSLELDYMSSPMGGPSGEDGGPAYIINIPLGIGLSMDRNGSFYRQGALNLFNRIATRAQWQRSSDPLERAIKNELNVYLQQPR